MLSKTRNIFRAIFLLALVSPMLTFAYSFDNHSSYEVCFTPGDNCTQVIVNKIAQAQQNIYVQAYSFTAAPIARALVEAKNRGVKVEVILDKSQRGNNRYSAYKFFQNQGVPVWIDYKPAIAHNKIMIIDNNSIVTGSFNFTQAAQNKNAENVIIIHDKSVEDFFKLWN